MKATILFALAGIFSIWYFADWHVSLPLVLFYAVLVINTYYCVRLFADIVPRDNRGQQAMDIILGIIYLFQAATIGNQLFFVYTAIILFTIATIKYVLLLSLIGYSAFLKQKILIDILGILACIFALGGVLLGYGLLTTWLWAIAFILANIYLLVIKPMYKLP